MKIDNPPVIRPQAQSSPARALENIYLNTLFVPLFVVVAVTSAAAGVNQCTAYCNDAATPTTQVARYAQDATIAGGRATLFWIVLPGYHYKLTTESGIMIVETWTEWY